MERIDRYEHLNNQDGITVSIREVAKQIVPLNYGAQRMLAEIVRTRELLEHNKDPKYPSVQNTAKLRQLLEEGWY